MTKWAIPSLVPFLVTFGTSPISITTKIGKSAFIPLWTTFRKGRKAIFDKTNTEKLCLAKVQTLIFTMTTWKCIIFDRGLIVSEKSKARRVLASFSFELEPSSSLGSIKKFELRASKKLGKMARAEYSRARAWARCTPTEYSYYAYRDSSSSGIMYWKLQHKSILKRRRGSESCVLAGALRW